MDAPSLMLWTSSLQAFAQVQAALALGETRLVYGSIYLSTKT